jgi:hypothetical protein
MGKPKSVNFARILVGKLYILGGCVLDMIKKSKYYQLFKKWHASCIFGGQRQNNRRENRRKKGF